MQEILWIQGFITAAASWSSNSTVNRFSAVLQARIRASFLPALIKLLEKLLKAEISLNIYKRQLYFQQLFARLKTNKI